MDFTLPIAWVAFCKTALASWAAAIPASSANVENRMKSFFPITPPFSEVTCRFYRKNSAQAGGGGIFRPDCAETLHCADLHAFGLLSGGHSQGVTGWNNSEALQSRRIDRFGRDVLCPLGGEPD